MQLYIALFIVLTLCTLVWLSIWLALRAAIVHPRHSGRRQLAQLDVSEIALADRLQGHIRAVASVPHNLYYPTALERSASYIEQVLIEAGLEPQRHPFRCRQGPVRNIEVVLEPAVVARAWPTLIVGAHYDSPDDSPGANDNGTGVAALIEIAKSLKDRPLTRRVRIVFYVNEEAPWGKTPEMGSWRHAKAMKDSGEAVEGMLALETLGHFSTARGSQQFPFPFGLLYGDRGDFVAFVGMLRGRRFVHDLVATFRNCAEVPSIGGVAPRAIEGIDLSDHWAYDQFGFPAAMVTDTAPFRNPYYHQTFDTPDKVDYPMLARVTRDLSETIATMASRPLR
ncbi:MAG: M28 family peptidase [Hyphomicrobium aestuarii]|nr:M28 family peptidase [Hyphomicrobium aestuarii]